jgi:fructose-1-phosphate kinase PfkB-like protein
LSSRSYIDGKSCFCGEQIMTPIYTLTGNLLWERTLEFTQWSPGKTQRATGQSFQVGGKGVNVSRMLTRLRAPTEALCFAGGSSGHDCETWMQAKGIPSKCFSTKEPTRIGAVIRGANHPETTFLSPDVPPDAEACSACTEYIDRLPSGSVLALCGSFPGWASESAAPIRAALTNFAQRGQLVIDSYGAPLEWARSQPASLIKINRDEFDALCPDKTGNRAFSERLQEALEASRVSAWIVTDGAEPVWIVKKDHKPRSLQPPSVPLVSPTGSGDVLLACILHAHFHRSIPLEEAVAFALPYASANAAHPGIADFDLNNLPT